MKITIIGAGKLGVMLAKTLTAENHDITVIDINEDKVEKLAEMLDVQGVGGSATHYNVLEEADMKNCDLFVQLLLMKKIFCPALLQEKWAQSIQ